MGKGREPTLNSVAVCMGREGCRTDRNVARGQDWAEKPASFAA